METIIHKEFPKLDPYTEEERKAYAIMDAYKKRHEKKIWEYFGHHKDFGGDM